MNEMSPKVKEVKTMEDYCIVVTFENQEKKVFDMKPYLKYDVFMPLENREEFENVDIEFGTVCWKCGADLSRDTLYIKGVSLDKQDVAVH